MFPSWWAALALVALGAAVLALVLATLANRRWARRPRPRTAEADLAAQLAALRDELASLTERVAATEDRTLTTRAAQDEGLARADHVAAVADDALTHARSAEDIARAAEAHATAAEERATSAAALAANASDPTALRHVAIVRYDAYADVGGRLSYSVALLDDTLSGLVLTTLSGKADVRTYVRAVSGGAGDGTLTDEEQQAVTAAAAGIPGSQS